MDDENPDDIDVTYPVPEWLRPEWDALVGGDEAAAYLSGNSEFKEEDHPRAKDGKWTSGSPESAAPKAEAPKRKAKAAPPAPGLPKGINPMPRMSPHALYLIHRWEKDLKDPDLVESRIRAFLSEQGDDGPNRDFKFYAQHGERMQFKDIPEDLLPVIAEAMDHQMPQPNACYYNSALWLSWFAKHDVYYCEGIMTMPSLSGPIQHAWLEVDGHVVDPSLILLGDEGTEGLVYVGVRFDPVDVMSVMAKEGIARPIALGPARPHKQRRLEDIEFT